VESPSLGYFWTKGFVRHSGPERNNGDATASCCNGATAPIESPALSRLFVVALAALLGAWLLVAERAVAAPKLEAMIAWQGECDDRAALRSEIEARGAELDEVMSSDAAVRLSILVRGTAGEHLLAEIELGAAGSHESRQVEARDCVALRRAVAWVLGVFAEERAAAARASEPSTAAFPAPPPARAAAPEPKQAVPVATLPRPTRPSQVGKTRSKPCVTVGTRFRLGSELLLGVGFVHSVALGPSVVGSYRPCAGWLPGIALGASQLVSLGYELDSRSIRLERTSAQLGAWLPLGVPALRAGLALEAGRIRATGSTSSAGPGRSGNAPWLAFVLPLRLAVPLLSPSLTADLGLDAAYTPLAFVLRYASGQLLARPSHFELRGAIGLAGHF
jgi:hypothetical protein